MDILISGASTGIGRATAVHMARKGHTVWAGVRSQKSFMEIQRLNVQGLEPVFLDVTDAASIENCISTVRKKSGILHGLVNNAGIAIGGPVEAVHLADWRRQFEVNVFGQIRVVQLCLPMIRESKGRIVMISSIAGRVASPFLAPYSASKFALEAIADSLRREMRKFDVPVSIVEPGPIATPIWEKSLGDGEKRKEELGPEMQRIYGSVLTRFNRRIEDAARSASPVHVVVHAIEHALTARSPRTRYPVGRGIALYSALSRILPDRWLDRMLS
jgi:NAD(P)-dependent dehydrogenase (short-subunit alcohol dehydrogenase family)